MSQALHIVAAFIAAAASLEVSATPKVGNVHRLRDFHDTKFEDFIVSAHLMQPVLLDLAVRGYFGDEPMIGYAIYESVRLSKLYSPGNPSLGTSTLLTPISYAAGRALASNVSLNSETLALYAKEALTMTDVKDAIMFYQAVRMAAPSYLGRLREEGVLPDIWDDSYVEKLISRKVRLWHVLWLSAEWDLVSREAVNGYPESRAALRYLNEAVNTLDWNDAVVETHLWILSRNPDSLIARKHGPKAASKASKMARKALEMGGLRSDRGRRYVKRIDRYFASMGWNPGATADLVAATIAFFHVEKYLTF